MWMICIVVRTQAERDEGRPFGEISSLTMIFNGCI